MCQKAAPVPKSVTGDHPGWVCALYPFLDGRRAAGEDASLFPLGILAGRLMGDRRRREKEAVQPWKAAMVKPSPGTHGTWYTASGSRKAR
jgi:hypothetical protein